MLENYKKLVDIFEWLFLLLNKRVYEVLKWSGDVGKVDKFVFSEESYVIN